MQQLFALLNPIHIGPVPVIMLRDLAALPTVNDTEYWLANIPSTIFVDAEYMGNKTRIALLTPEGVNQYLSHRKLTVDQVLDTQSIPSNHSSQPDSLPVIDAYINDQCDVTAFITTFKCKEWDVWCTSQLYNIFKRQYANSSLSRDEFENMLIKIEAALNATGDGWYLYIFPLLDASKITEKLRTFVSTKCTKGVFTIEYLFDNLSKLYPGLVFDIKVLGSVLTSNGLMTMYNNNYEAI